MNQMDNTNDRSPFHLHVRYGEYITLMPLHSGSVLSFQWEQMILPSNPECIKSDYVTLGRKVKDPGVEVVFVSSSYEKPWPGKGEKNAENKLLLM